MRKKTTYICVLLLLWNTISVKAQCAMCRAVLESQADTSQAEGVNNGIVFLMAIPYVLIGILGFYLYKVYGKKK